ncbi:MAG TPA: NAD(P)/FAD-dependent oxidoreductase [Xanthobacteraceae bacterium]|nr:NAD(P)/FAD-dependent oxidoreductase [Xanthobacteraceae bacterium]
MPITRRTFLASSAAIVAGPALGAVPASGDVDVVIVGAGAAGISAARRFAAAKRKYAVVEATDRIGGRCITETTTFGVPFDRGARWIHLPDINPVAQAAARAGIDVYGAPPGQKVRIGRRYAREGEMEDYLAAMVRAKRAIDDAARKSDSSCLSVLPKDLGDWQRTIEFTLGPYGHGKDLGDMSSQDFARSAERDIDAFCRIGYGAMLAKLGEGLEIATATPVTRINWAAKGGVEVETSRGKLTARAAVVTVSSGILTAGKIKFTPDLPRRQLDAASKLSLGSYDHIVLELPDNPLGLQRDELLFEKSDSTRTASVLGNMAGTTLCMVDVAGKFGRDLSAQGEPAMVAFALEWLGKLYGSDLKKAVRRTAATQWNAAPWTLGAMSAAAPGAQSSRKVLMESLGGRVWFAGEAAHETLWGTVNGAWESGDRAAAEVLKRLSGAAEPAQKRDNRRGRSQRS